MFTASIIKRCKRTYHPQLLHGHQGADVCENSVIFVLRWGRAAGIQVKLVSHIERHI